MAYLYGSRMNLYGDRGNLLALTQRCRWRGIEVDASERNLAEGGNLSEFDILIAGGGQDRDQISVSHDLAGDAGKQLIEAIESDVVVLTICGSYQLLGHSFVTSTGETLPGIGVFDARTVAGPRRFIGDIMVRAEVEERKFDLVGFENHGGVTYLGPAGRPFGRVILGAGNNDVDGTEGAVYRNAFGTYLHGPLLPKNPGFADFLLTLALKRRYADLVELEQLDDRLEQEAHAAVVERMKKRGRVRSGIA